jgi:hypothetical protein
MGLDWVSWLDGSRRFARGRGEAGGPNARGYATRAARLLAAAVAWKLQPPPASSWPHMLPFPYLRRLAAASLPRRGLPLQIRPAPHGGSRWRGHGHRGGRLRAVSTALTDGRTETARERGRSSGQSSARTAHSPHTRHDTWHGCTRGRVVVRLLHGLLIRHGVE